ncbi:hypothetical protein DQG23_07440 [Paenibacillus contaminans]|uniref:Uncharacterized protein n=1 Tax=Paenibacillus contaminans TaxID=450362 RepID=A0A329MRD3_9BACL|nr:hypothetical protein DQG23_07440 [Paenibacillus contaminans]
MRSEAGFPNGETGFLQIQECIYFTCQVLLFQRETRLSLKEGEAVYPWWNTHIILSFELAIAHTFDTV